MATNEERLKILTMLQEGIISAEEASKLLEALEERKPAAAGAGQGPAPDFGPNFPFNSPGSPKGRFLRVRVTDTNTGKTRVNVRVPTSIIGSGIKFGMKFAPQVEGLDPDELMHAIQSGELGQIVDVYDEEDGEHVEVFIE